MNPWSPPRKSRYILELEREIEELKEDKKNREVVEEERRNREVEIEYRDLLNKLNKDELIDYIGSYWIDLKKEAENKIKDEVNYMMKEFGNAQMTQVNKMRNLLYYISDNKR